MEFNELIKQRRLELGLTQEEVAKQLFVSRQAVSNWETGKNMPDFSSLVLITKLYNVSLVKLIDQKYQHLLHDKDVILWKRYNYLMLGLTLVIALFMILALNFDDNDIFFYLAIISWVALMFVCWLAEILKKRQNISTYKEARKFLKTSQKNKKEV